MRIYPGYDKFSKTLVGPERSQGDCLGPDWPGGRTLVWWDTFPPIYNGDVCVIALAPPGHPIQLAAKVLQVTRAGQWFGICDAGPLPLDRLYVVGVAKVVACEVLPVVSWSAAADPPPPELCEQIAELSADAIAEWESHGYPPPTRFPGLPLDPETQAAAWAMVRDHSARVRA